MYSFVQQKLVHLIIFLTNTENNCLENTKDTKNWRLCKPQWLCGTSLGGPQKKDMPGDSPSYFLCLVWNLYLTGTSRIYRQCTEATSHKLRTCYFSCYINNTFLCIRDRSCLQLVNWFPEKRTFLYLSPCGIFSLRNQHASRFVTKHRDFTVKSFEFATHGSILN